MLRQAARAEVGAEAPPLGGARLLGRDGRWTIACRGGRIDSIAPARGDEDGAIDLAGALVLPGFHDPHVHLLSLAREREQVVLPDDIAGWDAIGRPAAARAATLGPGRWLRLRRFDEATMTAGRLPDRRDLDAIAADRPVRLQHRNLRLDVLNTEGLRRCGLLDGTSAAAVERDGAGRPTGRIFQGGGLVADPTDRPSPAALRDLVAAASADLLAAGVTSIQDAGAHNGAAELALLDRLATDGAIRQRLWTMVSAIALRDGEVGALDPARVRHAKLEAIEARLDLDAMAAAAAAARRAGLGLAVHATSPAEIAAALATIGSSPVDSPAAPATIGPSPVVSPAVPDRIEHASVAPPETVAAVAAAGAAVVANPGLVLEGGDRYRAEFGPAELPHLHRLAGWLAAGVPLALAGDAPVTAAPALAMLRAAVRRETRDGFELRPAERLTVGQAVRAMTAVPAALVGRGDLGRLAPGQAADLVVLAGDDPLADPVWLTILGGEVVHDAGAGR
ncbi:MAG TPA: amidohydrolase family protein [Solirubrobacterales bacterium]|nr:amidohydrolase family protein [Solirubrobacterales bacterium]